MKTTAMSTCAVCVGLFLLAPAATADAQMIWHDHTRPQSLWLEFNHVEYDVDGIGFLTSSNAIGGRLRISDSQALTAEIPLGYGDVETSFGSESDFAIGNPWLGFEHTPNDRFLLEAAVRVPLADGGDFGAQAASGGEIVDRFSAYIDEFVVLHVVPNLLSNYEDGFRTRLRGGPAFWIPTSGGDLEITLDYGATLGYEKNGFGGDVGLTGWMFVTADGADLGERTLFQAGAQLYRRFSSGGRIGLLFRLPLDEDASGTFEYTLGVKASLAVQ